MATVRRAVERGIVISGERPRACEERNAKRVIRIAMQVDESSWAIKHRSNVLPRQPNENRAVFRRREAFVLFGKCSFSCSSLVAAQVAQQLPFLFCLPTTAVPHAFALSLSLSLTPLDNISWRLLTAFSLPAPLPFPNQYMTLSPS